MTQSSRRLNPTTYVAVAVSLLALLVAATSTAYAAGLAKNSVGAKQIKSNAVRSAEIKSNAVTTTELKDSAVTSGKIAPGAVTADRIASGVVPAKTVHVARPLTVSGNVTPLLQLGGLSFDAQCNSALQDFVEVSVTRVGGGSLTIAGFTSLETSTTDSATPFVDDSTTELELFIQAPSNDGFGAYYFDGVVTPAGGGPVKVQVAVQVDDNNSTPCQTYVTATPIG
jgi:hypothetical protein